MSTVPQPDGTVSVVMTAYNSGGFLDTAVASVYGQTVAPTEVIVINDGSTDDTEDRLRRLACKLPASFIWKTKQHGGLASALNLGISVTTSDYVAFLDHDDTWHPRKLERQVQHFASSPGLTLSFTGYRINFEGYRPAPGRSGYAVSVIDHERWDSDPDAVLAHLLTGRWPTVSPSTVMIRRERLARLPPLDERITIATDLSLYLELAVRRMKLDYWREPLVNYRVHDTNLSRDTGRLWEDVCDIYDRFWGDHASDLSDQLRDNVPRWRAHRHLQTAIDAIRHGDTTRSRRHILNAARIRPASIRPGWIRMLGIGPPPAGPWPE